VVLYYYIYINKKTRKQLDTGTQDPKEREGIKKLNTARLGPWPLLEYVNSNVTINRVRV
jgi:hypothetical protein